MQKTSVMVEEGRRSDNHNIFIAAKYQFEKVSSFEFVGSIAAEADEAMRRISALTRAYFSLRKELMSHLVRREAKLHLYIMFIF